MKKHTVCINIADGGTPTPVIQSRKLRLPMRLLTALFGPFTEVMILSPGKSVSSVEIHQVRGGAIHDAV